ncbi:hypothetical protein ColTof3_09766 [Colletotrichum tofieldiae]|nr:hypothetical protein ColTof3_09766 [Colletotrichum tofieldiae]
MLGAAVPQTSYRRNCTAAADPMHSAHGSHSSKTLPPWMDEGGMAARHHQLPGDCPQQYVPLCTKRMPLRRQENPFNHSFLNSAPNHPTTTTPNACDDGLCQVRTGAKGKSKSAQNWHHPSKQWWIDAKDPLINAPGVQPASAAAGGFRIDTYGGMLTCASGNSRTFAILEGSWRHEML